MQPMFSSQPMVTKMKCCSKMMKCNKREKQQSNKTCEGNSCNPFMACASGNFYLMEKTSLTFTNLPINKKKNILINDNRLSDNLSNCWRPPRMLPFQKNS
jgi:hypothetical protein